MDPPLVRTSDGLQTSQWTKSKGETKTIALLQKGKTRIFFKFATTTIRKSLFCNFPKAYVEAL